MKSMARVGFCLAVLTLPCVVSACSDDSSDPKDGGSAGKSPATFAGTSSVAGTSTGTGGGGSGGSNATAGSSSTAGAGGKGMNPHHTGGTCDLVTDCATGLMCDATGFERGMCTADCTDDTQCETKYGVCFEGKCWGKCDDMGACKRKGWVCSADGTPHCVAGAGTGGSGAGGSGVGGSSVGGSDAGGTSSAGGGGSGGTGGDVASGGDAQ